MPVCCCTIGCQHSTCCLVAFSWYDVITSKSKQIISAHFQMLFSTICYFLMFLNISIRFDYVENIQAAIYFNNQKIIAYHL